VPDPESIKAECVFTTSRSSGPGGQHVNKTESKVELRFNILTSKIITDADKMQLLSAFSGRLVEEDSTLLITVQDTRSQSANKKIAVQRLLLILKEALKVKKTRKRTLPSKAAVAERIKDKKVLSLKKQNRSKPRSGENPEMGN
jgi:ribosome-associated protein